MTIYIYLLLFPGKYLYIQKPRNSIQHVPISKVGLRDFFSLNSYHTGVQKIWGTRKNGIIDSVILFYVNWKWKGLATLFGHLRSFTAACTGGKLAFSGFPPL